MVGNPNQLEDCQNFEALPNLTSPLSYSVTKGTSVPIVSVDSACFADDYVIGAGLIDEVTLPQTCSSILITFGTDQGQNFDLIINEYDEQGDGLKQKAFAPGTSLSLDDWPVRTIKVIGVQGANWGYMAFVKPRKGLGFTVEA